MMPGTRDSRARDQRTTRAALPSLNCDQPSPARFLATCATRETHDAKHWERESIGGRCCFPHTLTRLVSLSSCVRGFLLFSLPTFTHSLSLPQLATLALTLATANAGAELSPCVVVLDPGSSLTLSLPHTLTVSSEHTYIGRDSLSFRSPSSGSCHSSPAAAAAAATHSLAILVTNRTSYSPSLLLQSYDRPDSVV